MNKYFKILYPLNLTNCINTSNMTMVVEYPNLIYKLGIFLPKSDQTKSKSFIFFVMQECGVDKIWAIFEFSRSGKNIGLVE